MRAVTPADLAHSRQVSPLTPPRLPSIPSPTTWRTPDVAFSVTSAHPIRTPMALQLRRSLAGSPTHPAETGSLSYRLLVRPQLLSTPLHGDAVSFSYAWRDHHTAGTLTLLTKRPHGRTRERVSRSLGGETPPLRLTATSLGAANRNLLSRFSFCPPTAGTARALRIRAPYRRDRRLGHRACGRFAAEVRRVQRNASDRATCAQVQGGRRTVSATAPGISRASRSQYHAPDRALRGGSCAESPR